jgi:NAD(P)-dependent dehydrogenase (short-subunit alcohol dehydrogenase family)
MAWDVGAGLEGKGVIVTGATGGIGRATAEAFAIAGARVLAVDLDENQARQAADQLAGEGHESAGVDLTDLSTHRGLIRQAVESFGGVYALAHLAAVLRRRDSIYAVTEEDWDAQLDVNLKASFFLCRAAAEAMSEADKGGRIVAFSSQGWWSGGFGGSVVYCASKGGVLMDGLSEEAFETLKSQTPLQRVADPKEIASVVVFLASDHASYISGATINVSGGFLMY